MGTDFAKGFGTFLQSLGQSSMGIVQKAGEMKAQKDALAAEAPYKKLKMDLLKQSYEKGKLDLDNTKMEAAKKKGVENELKALQRILSKKEVQDEIKKRITEQTASPATGEVPGSEIVIQPGSSRPPTLAEQVQRLQGSGFDVSPYKEVREQVQGVREAYKEQQAPVLEAQKFEREQQGKIDMQELKGEQAIELEAYKNSIKDKLKTSNFTDTQKKDVYKFLDRVDKDPIIKLVDKAVVSAGSIRQLIEARSKLAPSVVEVQMPRLMGEVGNLAQQEQLKWAGSQAWYDKGKRFFKKGWDGRMTEIDVNEILGLLDTFEAELAKKALNKVTTFEKQSGSVSGIGPEEIGVVSQPFKDNYNQYLKSAPIETNLDDEFESLYNSVK